MCAQPTASRLNAAVHTHKTNAVTELTKNELKKKKRERNEVQS